MNVQYEWKKDQPFQRWVGDAQEIGEHIAGMMADNNGQITPQMVVADASNDLSPLHPNFVWDDLEAARLHREHTARNLIGAIVHVTLDERVLRVPVRAFVSIERGPYDRGYQPIIQVMRDPLSKDIFLKQGLSALLKFKGKFQAYEEFAVVVDAIDLITESFEPAIVEEVLSSTDMKLERV